MRWDVVLTEMALEFCLDKGGRCQCHGKICVSQDGHFVFVPTSGASQRLLVFCVRDRRGSKLLGSYKELQIYCQEPQKALGKDSEAATGCRSR